MSRTSRVVSELKPSGIRDFFELVMGMENVISLGVGEPDFTTPMHVRQQIIQSLEDGYTNYTSNKGLLELRETLSEFIQEHHGVEYDPREELLVTTGVSEAMDLAMRALINPGDGVLIPTPSYISYEPTARMAGGEVTFIPTDSNTEFKLTPAQLRDSVREESKILVLNYPANPTGITYDRQVLEELADVVAQEDLLVVSDEIYDQLTYEEQHVCFASIPGMRDRTVYLNGFSKSYAMTGMRVGYAAGPPDILSTMTKIHQYTMLCAPTSSQFGAIEALLNGSRSVQSMREEYQARRDLVVHRFRSMGLPCVEPEGAFYAFPSLGDRDTTAPEFCRELLEEKKVAAVPGNAFGERFENHIRVSYATARDQLREALDRIENFVNARYPLSGASVRAESS